MGIGEIEDAVGRKQRSDRLGPADDVGRQQIVPQVVNAMSNVPSTAWVRRWRLLIHPPDPPSPAVVANAGVTRSIAASRAAVTALPNWIKPQLTRLVDSPTEGLAEHRWVLLLHWGSFYLNPANMFWLFCSSRKRHRR
jgi:hypothetical protein